MAVKYVITGSTDLSLAASYDGAALPSAGDEVFVRDGNQTIVTGLTAVAINRLVFTAGFKGRVGTNATAVSFRVDNGTTPRVEIEGGQYYNLSVSTGISEVTVATAAPVYLNGATAFTRVVVHRGTVEVGANTPVTNLHVLGGRVTQQYNATGNTLATVSGGTLATKRGATTLTAEGGVSFLVDDAAFTTVNVGGAAQVYHQSTGTIGTLNEYNGLYSPDGAKQDTTVTTANRYGGRLVVRAGVVNADIGTLNDYARAGTETTPGGGIMPGFDFPV
jgi:hypothetical protein